MRLPTSFEPDFDAERQEAILSLLREHFARYSLRDLRERIIQNGYDPVAVDRAIQIFLKEAPPAPPRVWPKALLVGVSHFAIVMVLILVQWNAWPLILVCSVGIGSLEFLMGLLLLASRDTQDWGLVLIYGLILFAGLAICGFPVLLVYSSAVL